MKRAALNFLLVLFVVLQAHAPLVHAHVGGDVHHAVGHLDVHETHTHESSATEMHASDYPTQIVEIARAIKERGVLIAGFIAILIAFGFIFSPRLGAQRVPCLLHSRKSDASNYRSAPRAPPSA